MLENLIKKIPILNRKYKREELDKLIQKTEIAGSAKKDQYKGIEYYLGLDAALHVAKVLDKYGGSFTGYSMTMQKISTVRLKGIFYLASDFLEKYIETDDRIFSTLRNTIEFWDELHIPAVMDMYERYPSLQEYIYEKSQRGNQLQQTIRILQDDAVYELLSGLEGDRLYNTANTLHAATDVRKIAQRIMQKDICEVFDYYEPIPGFLAVYDSIIRKLDNEDRLTAALKEMMDERTLKFIDSKKVDTVYAIRLVGHFANNNLFRVINLIEKMEDSLSVRTVARALPLAKDLDTALKVYEKYGANDHISHVIITSEGLYDLSVLLKDDVYEAVQKDPNIIVKYLCDKYGILRTRIKDQEFANDISFGDMDLIDETYSLVESIHGERKKFYVELREGFYKELNRAIDQGRNFKSKSRNVRRYCNEVQSKIKQRAEELMFVE